MSQNAAHLCWTFSEVDDRLQAIMREIFCASHDAAIEYGVPGNYVVGANIAGFKKLADAVMAQGVV
jgi:glutamate dehydrogenase (NADP+)